MRLEKTVLRKCCLDDFHDIRREFCKQHLAFEYADSISNSSYSENIEERHVGIFACEIAKGGIRKYVVDTFGNFALKEGSEEKRGLAEAMTCSESWYEVLREERPCYLYMDIEYLREQNENLDGDRLIQEIKFELLCYLKSGDLLPLFEDHEARASVNDYCIEMDSTTSVKFSRHLIFRYFLNPQKSLLFPNTLAAGTFMEAFINWASLNHNTRFMAQNDGREQLIIDLSVYSRNRCFRLLWNSKFGKQIPLLYVPSSTLTERQPWRSVAPLLFLHSMASWVLPTDQPQDIGFFPVKQKSIRLSKAHPNVTAMFEEVDGVNEDIKAIVPICESFAVQSWDAFRAQNTESFQSGFRGSVASKLWFKDSEILVLSLAGNRYCDNIRRDHKSNGVILVLDFNKKVFYQKCHDFDCRNYQSCDFPLVPLQLHEIGLDNFD